MTESHKPEEHSSQEIDELFASEDDAEKAREGCFYLFFFVLALAVAVVVAIYNA